MGIAMFEHTEDKALDRIAEKLILRLLPALQDRDGKPAARMMTTRAAADYLGLSVSSVEHLRHRRLIPCVKINRRNMYDRLALNRWLASKSGTTESPPKTVKRRKHRGSERNQ
jgi:hypothetical protein